MFCLLKTVHKTIRTLFLKEKNGSYMLIKDKDVHQNTKNGITEEFSICLSVLCIVHVYPDHWVINPKC